MRGAAAKTQPGRRAALLERVRRSAGGGRGAAVRSLACLALVIALPALAQPKPEGFAKFSQWTKARMTDKGSGTAFIARSLSDRPVGATETVQLAATSTAITDDAGSDYQGAYIAIVGADDAGNVTDVRPVKTGFKT